MSRLLQRALEDRKLGQKTIPDVDLFHISFQRTDDIDITIYPQIPVGSETDNEENSSLLGSEPDIPRISFSPTVEQCFRAVYPNVSHLFEEKKYPHMDYYVYRANPQGDERFVFPDRLTERRFVMDAHITEEHWCLSPIEVELIARVRIHRPKNNRMLESHFFNDRSLPKIEVGPKEIDYSILWGSLQ